MNTKKVIIILIILILVIMIFMGLVIWKLNNHNQEELDNEQESYDSGEATLEPETTVYKINSSDMMFFTISNCIKNTFKLDYNIYVWDLYCINRVSTETYFAHIVTNKKETNYIAINIDHDSSAYDIEKLSINDYENIILNEIPQKYIEDIAVNKNDNNSINYTSLSNDQISKYYMEMINDLLINYPEVIYERLAEDYKEKKFKTYEEFQTYCINRTEFIKEKEYMTYSSGSINGKKVYKTKDANQKIYIIEESETDEFSIYLDDYTIDTDEFKRLYSEAKDELKASTNAEKFIKMLNNQDYNAIYNLLNNNYKNSNFPTEDSFREYLVREFYKTNIIRSSQVEEEGNYYIVTIDICEDARASALSQKKNIIIALGEETDFEMSIAL